MIKYIIHCRLYTKRRRISLMWVFSHSKVVIIELLYIHNCSRMKADTQLSCCQRPALIINVVQPQLLPDLQLFDGLSSFADDQADFVGGDEDLLDGAVTVHVTVEARTVATLLHYLIQQPLSLTVWVGGADTATNNVYHSGRRLKNSKLPWVTFVFVSR